MSLLRSVNIWRYLLGKQIDQIECDHKDLLLAHTLEPSAKEILDAHDHKMFFNDAWDSVKIRFLTLCQFSDGLASVLFNTTLIKSNFLNCVYWEGMGCILLNIWNSWFDESREGVV